MYKLNIIDINATDNPLSIEFNGIIKYYGVEGLPWKLISDNQEVLKYIFTNFVSDIEL